MPSNNQVQVKMSPKARKSVTARNQPSLAPANQDPVVITGKTVPSRAAEKFPDFAGPESKRATRVPSVAKESPRDFWYRFAKRCFDLSLGLVLLMMALPIVAIAALAIRINTPGSPFFFQTRVGKSGKPFKIFKLRGMYIDARTRFPHFYDYSQKQDLEFCFHHENDPRVTKAGKFIRKTSIDELPNLWNVVTGDMSLVGPRPEIPDVLALYGQYRTEYLSVKPGVTCLSKVTGRDRLTKRETIEFDLRYIRSRSFFLDLKILWKTFRSVVLRRDVF
jgi:lipopolysaccharide/colanic/teichoic acid biosynthesis glycosyltransferase